MTDTTNYTVFSGMSYIAKLKNDGSFVWAKSYSAVYNSIKITPKNNIIFEGFYYDTTYFPTTNGNVALDPIGSFDNFFAKLDSNGNAIWLRAIGSEANDSRGKLAFSNSTHIYYLMKSISDTLYYNSNRIFINKNIKNRQILLEIDLDGKLKRTQLLSYSNKLAYHNIVGSKNKNELYLVGNFKNKAETLFDTSIYKINGKLDSGIFIIQLDSTLKSGWAKPFGAVNNALGLPTKIAASTDLFGGFYSGGYFSGTVDFDPGKGITNKTSITKGDIFLHKLSPCKIQRSIRKDTICGGDSLVIGENIYKESGSYIDNYYTTKGCDSLVTTVLFVTIQKTDTANYKICEGDSVVVDGKAYKKEGQYVSLYPLPNHCDSTFVLNLKVDTVSRVRNEFTICKGESITIANSVYKVSGNYWDTLQSKNGCDSIIYTKLTVNPTYTINQKKRLCFGEKLSVGNTKHTKSGNYSDTLLTTMGCDSIINTNLIIDEQIISKQTLRLCAADSAIVGHHIYTSSGTYSDTLISTRGCDSLVITTVEKIDLTIDTTTINRLTINQKNASYQWLDCEDDMRPLVRETNRSLSVRNNGTYAVEVSYKGCKDTSECVSINFKEVKATSFLIYPNPTNNSVTMVLPTSGNLQLYSSIGKLVQNQDFNAGENTLVVGHFSSGLYTIKFNSKFGVIFEKLIIYR